MRRVARRGIELRQHARDVLVRQAMKAVAHHAAVRDGGGAAQNACANAASCGGERRVRSKATCGSCGCSAISVRIGARLMWLVQAARAARVARARPALRCRPARARTKRSPPCTTRCPTARSRRCRQRAAQIGRAGTSTLRSWPTAALEGLLREQGAVRRVRDEVRLGRQPLELPVLFRVPARHLRARTART